MSTNQRGCRNLIIFLGLAFLGVILVPIILLPGIRQAVTLPVISVPSEPYLEGWQVFGVTPVNSLGGALLAMVIVLLIALVARRYSNGWTKEIPGRFQALVEIIVDALWGLTKQQAGNKPRVRNLLFPLVASLFLYLLAGNWGKLIPGVETVGVLHCAIYEPSPISGFPVMEVTNPVGSYFVLRSERVLNTGVKATADSFHSCEAFMGVSHYKDLLPKQLDPYLDQAVTYTTLEGDTLNSIVKKFNEEASAKASSDLVQPAKYVTVAYEGWKPLEFTVADVVLANTGEDGVVGIQLPPKDNQEAEKTTDEHATEATTAEATPEATTETSTEATTTDAVVVAKAADGRDITGDTVLEPGKSITIRKELLGAEATTLQNQLFMVTPFVRGMTTDLSFTIGLALLAFFAIQFFGVSELGLNYFQKFINVHAVGNIGKNPMGAIDFVVGLFEIISELGKIVSLSFRLFGAIFAGTVLFSVIMFLTGTTIPALIMVLEVITGFSQAAVFAILTLIFSSQAMVSHIHDEDHGDHAEHSEAHH